MYHNLTVDMCVGIRKNCPISYLITADNQAEFSFGDQRDGFHYAFDAAALRAFLKVGAEALAELEGTAADDTEATAVSELVTIGRRSA